MLTFGHSKAGSVQASTVHVFHILAEIMTCCTASRPSTIQLTAPTTSQLYTVNVCLSVAPWSPASLAALIPGLSDMSVQSTWGSHWEEPIQQPCASLSTHDAAASSSTPAAAYACWHSHTSPRSHLHSTCSSKQCAAMQLRSTREPRSSLHLDAESTLILPGVWDILSGPIIDTVTLGPIEAQLQQQCSDHT